MVAPEDAVKVLEEGEFEGFDVHATPWDEVEYIPVRKLEIPYRVQARLKTTVEKERSISRPPFRSEILRYLEIQLSHVQTTAYSKSA